MRRVLIPLVVILLIAAVISSFVQLQPAGQARVVRYGTALHVLDTPVGIAARFGGTSCLVRTTGGRLYFEKNVSVVRRADAFDLAVSFTYAVPRAVPAAWPGGDWCTSLSRRVDELAMEAVADLSTDTAAADLRATNARISERLRAALQRAGVAPRSVAARIILPAGTERLRTIPAIARDSRRADPVIFIGLDGADWQLLDDYMARGLMPNLAALAREGTRGPLTTEHPPLSPLLWTSMMTGVSPLDHGILDFTRFNPSTGNKEPITSDERRTPAIWNMATMAGKRVAVFGLWATWPAEPVRGLDVSDRLFTFLFSESAPPPGIVFPPGRESWARETLQDAERTIDYAAMKAYLPWLTEADYAALVKEPDPYARPGSALRRILVETEVYSRLSMSYLGSSVPRFLGSSGADAASATSTIENRRTTGKVDPAAGLPDLTIVYFQGTDTIGHIFAPYAPPRQPSISQDDYDRYHQVPELYFRHIDDVLGQYRKIAEASHAVLMLASDHGFHWKEDRPTSLSSFAAASAAKWHRNEGIFLVEGGGVASRRSGAGGIRQVCATLAALSGLPQDQHAAQPPLVSLRSSNTATVDYRRFWQRAQPLVSAGAQTGSDEALAKLRALGYIGPGESVSARPGTEAAGSTKTAGAWNNEGLILKHDGRRADALAAFDKALTIDPTLASAAWNESDLLFETQQSIDRADDLLIRALTNGLPEAPKYVIERAIKYQRSGRAPRSLHLLEGAVSARPGDEELRMFRGRYRVELKDCAGALEDFRAAQQIKPDDPIAFASAGLASMCLGNQPEAQQFFRRSLDLNPNQPLLRRYLGQ